LNLRLVCILFLAPCILIVMLYINHLADGIKNTIENLTKKFSRRSHFELNQKLDQDLVFGVIKSKKLPSFRQLKYISKFYSPPEILVTKIALFFILAGLLVLGTNLYLHNLIIHPKEGGEYIEAVIGAPSYINPLFAQTNDIDQDLSRLIFSSLMKLNEQGQLAGDLVESYEIDEEQKTYTFTLKPDIYWHDGVRLAASDVVFTVESIQDQNFKSPLYATFRNIQVREVDDRTVKFTLPEPFAPFLSVLTFGILPEHLWQEIEPSHAILAELNLKPIGSGPYKFVSLTKDKKGNVREYKLQRFDKYFTDGPYIEKISFKFFGDFDTAKTALTEGNVDGVGFLPQHFNEIIAGSHPNLQISHFSLPQYTALFFNQGSAPALAEKAVRQALSLGTSKNQIIESSFPNLADPVDEPILPGMIGYEPNLPKFLYDPAQAEKILDDAGWKRVYPETEGQEPAESETQNFVTRGSTSLGVPTGETAAYTRQKSIKTGDKTELTTLEITLTTVQKDKNIVTAEIVRDLWQKIGVKVNLQIVDLNKVQKEIIKPRAYQVLLFGQIIGRDPDPYSFWHSSKINDPGLNLAMYSNKEVDKLLEDARKTSEEKVRQEKYVEFQQKLINDIPAIFLYSLKYTYTTPNSIKGIGTERINQPADRFGNIENWYIKTKKRIDFTL